jgi:branched-chain amino acid transport system substrate-binding protein
MENLSITNDMMAANGLAGIGPEFNVTCENHGGPGLGAVQQWDAASGTWSLISDFSEPDMSIIQPLIDEDSKAYADENNIATRCN